jgi:hypothetical protein
VLVMEGDENAGFGEDKIFFILFYTHNRYL